MGFKSSTKKLFVSDEAPVPVTVAVQPQPHACVMVRTPNSFEDVKEYADGLMAGNVVLINLENLDGAVRNSIFDYMNGVAYIKEAGVVGIGNDGQILVYTPKGMMLDKKDPAENNG